MRYEDDVSYPTAVFLIIATEFCERFSFCGLRTILSIYLRNELLFSENASTIIYHVFIMVCYTVPVAGALCADSILGRYQTILYFSLVYLFGNILMCIGAIPTIDTSSITLSAIGLILIAIGTGGIKPCVAAFGGDQFHLPAQKNMLQHFFAIFYFTINLGGFVGMIVTPVLRKWVSCFGDDTCYALGFGFPAFLMFISVLLFVMGKSWYRLKKPKENVVIQFFKCAMYALVHKSKKKKHQHWLDVAKGTYDQKLIRDMKTVCAVLFLYIPVPIFWSLFDQQGSRWTFQASHMDGNVFGMQIVPDQMQVVNPAMVLILIPFFDKLFNPCFTKLRIMENSLHRMAIGGLFAAFAFLAAGTLELFLEKSYPKLPSKKHASINIINTLPCYISVQNPFNGNQQFRPGSFHKFEDLNSSNFTEYALRVIPPEICGNIDFGRHTFKLEAVVVEDQTDTGLIGINAKDEIEILMTDPVDFQKTLSGRPRIRIAYIKGSHELHNITVSLKNLAGFEDIYYVHDLTSSALSDSAYMELPQGIYDCAIASKENPHLLLKSFDLALGGVYSLVIRERNGNIELYTMSAPNTINILWLLPQYFLISVAEILFGVAGLEFSFTQAPKSMKTVTIAGWYLSVAVGNFLVIIITQANLFGSQAQEFFLFAVVMVGDMMVFIEMASQYTFVQLEADSSAYLGLAEEVPLVESNENH